jgi:signal transduction histidine kinase/DNA-binding response OmpR family regulator/ABC-type amino acid transport substrate-binding protein/HPt (histidine-containing phosphotransfer) domain-containing protein
VNLKRTITVLTLCAITIYTAGCPRNSDQSPPDKEPFTAYRDIPGITAQEIAAIEAIKKEYTTFTYAMTPSTEAFLREDDDTVGGYAALFCEWLTELFDIRFQPEIYAWGDLVRKLNAGELDFAGNITPTEERRNIYHMTDPIADRQYKTIQLTGSPALDRIASTRPLRYVFIEGAAIAETVASVTESDTYEALFVRNYEEAYRMLESENGDAFIGDNAVVSSFDSYGNVYTNDFLPLIFSPVSMATAKAELEPFISAVTKALRGGVMPYLNHLYSQGYESYKKNKLFMQLNDEEKAYLHNPSPVLLLARSFNYPVDFYNTHEKEWEGIAFDVLNKVEELTGLTFQVANNEQAQLSDLLTMLRNGEAHIIPELIFSNERKQYYIWTEHKFITDQYALLSKSQYPNVSAHEIPSKRVGLIRDTVRTELFHTWFPNAVSVTVYSTDEEAFSDLEQDKLDMVMASKNRLLSILNYYEFSDYKANYLFNYPYEATFGFHKDQTILRSIMDKALPLVDTLVITEQWMTKTYDYKTKLIEEQRPWLISATILLLLILGLLLTLFLKTRNEGKRLAKLVKEVSEANRLKNISITLMESVLNSVDAMIFVNDPETYEILFLNDSMKRQFGIKGDCIGQPCYKILRRNRDSACEFCPCFKLEKEPDKAVIWEERNPITNTINHNVDRLIDWPNGKKVHIQHSVDMTELIEAKEFAEQSSRYKSSFLATVSHEIRTPMNAILGITEIQLQNENSPELREALEKIHNSGYLLLGIINDILDLSKIEAGKLELIPIKYDVASLIHDTIHLNALRYENKPLEVVLKVDENIPSEMFGDELRIKQILNNLLSNAFKYTDFGEVSLWVTVESPPPEEESKQVTVIFRVSDTGQGMTREQIDKLFDEYTRFNLEANRATIGTGLGMSITQHLVRMMNGEISVESEPDKGSTFTVRLPQETVGAVVLGKEIAENLQQFHLGKSSHREKAPQIVRDYMPYGRVLIVDDVETNLYVARGLMSPYGLSIETAESGFEAIDKIKSGASYDIIFMDHFMPKMDGIETTKQIRALGYTNPIVALTANALTGQAEMFLENGFEGFISKPIDIRQLNATLNQSIRDKYPADIVEAARRLKDDLRKYSAGGGKPMDTQLAKIFMRDGQKALTILEAFYEKRDAYEDKDIQQYIINSHSMKSALAIIGESDLSVFAAKLEQAGRERNMPVIADETPVFLNSLRAVMEKIKPREDAHNDEMTVEDRNFLREKLIVIQGACVKYDKKTAKDAVAELQGKTWPARITEQLESIADRLLHSEFEEAAKLASSDV